ncbi:hypothetical protein SDC9_150133 [bioreactor metagenome]|uniref:Uncharacterized protein n=1 Tax=bioreactor metagenome TaxID=1076179 RepID=A0A645ENR9_9ZZZZ
MPLPRRQIPGCVRGQAVDDLRKNRLRLELRKLLAAVAPLPLVDLVIQFLQRVRRNLDSLIVQKVRERAVEVVVPLVGHDVHYGAVDVEQESADHKLNLLRQIFASWISRSR